VSATAGRGTLLPDGYRLPATGYRLPATGYRLPATGYRLPATGNWQLATGNWQLATGNWQLATRRMQYAPTGNWLIAWRGGDRDVARMDGTVGPEQGRRFTPSSTALIVLLVAGVIGAVSLARQPILVAPQPPSPPAWSVPGYDNARSGHSRATPLDTLTSVRWRVDLGASQTGAGQTIAAPPVIDGDGNSYYVRGDGALLMLKKDGMSGGCVALKQPADPACVGSVAGPPSAAIPSVLAAPDKDVYVVNPRGDFERFSPTDSNQLTIQTPPTGDALVPEDGLVASKYQDETDLNAPPPSYLQPFSLYGVVRLGPGSRYQVREFDQTGQPVADFNARPIRASRLTPISVAPDGTLLVVAQALRPGGNATLWALDAKGRNVWTRALAPGIPSYAAVEGPNASSHWLAWVAVSRPGSVGRSWVFAVDSKGRRRFTWSVGHSLVVTNSGVALAHPSRNDPVHTALGCVSSDRGVYVIALSRRRAATWLILDAHVSGVPGPPTLDNRDVLYVGTSVGHVYAKRLDGGGHVIWRYDTGRDAHYYPVEPYPTEGKSVLVISRDRATGHDVVEALLAEAGAGIPVTTIVPPTPVPTNTVTPTPVPTNTVTPTPVPTNTITPTPVPTTTTTTTTLTLTPAVTGTGTGSILTTTPTTGTATGTPALGTLTPSSLLTSTATATPPLTVTATITPGTPPPTPISIICASLDCPTPTPTATPTMPPTATPTMPPTATPTMPPTATTTPLPTGSVTPSASVTMSLTTTATMSPTTATQTISG